MSGEPIDVVVDGRTVRGALLDDAVGRAAVLGPGVAVRIEADRIAPGQINLVRLSDLGPETVGPGR
ncbi:hypothetical protein ACFQE5_18705 [Pseudonocardia hispaniensis]|uniref:TRAM domain-containing protein n=1 Tax=Pseudonocardia hispaniensis TaxID=904933 RepID=A0ABW1J716_9PSEU